MPRGGKQPGAGRPRIYSGGTAWVTIPIPAEVAAGVGKLSMRARIVGILSKALRPSKWPKSKQAGK